MDRYEIRPYGEKIHRNSKNRKDKGKKPSQFYGIWDNKSNNWVVNAKDIGRQKAIKILKALSKNHNINEIKTFWRE